MARTSTSNQPWPVKKEHSDHMAMRQKQNRARDIPAENWMADKLVAARWDFTRQARWGFRLYDFWFNKIGVAIEVDGPEHKARVDIEKDLLDWERSAIIVLRVRSWQEHDADVAIRQLSQYPSWNARRASLGKSPIRGAL